MPQLHTTELHTDPIHRESRTLEIPDALLVIGDHESDLAAIGIVLAPLGRELVLARTSDDSLARILDRDVALIVLDATSTVRGGVAMARSIREDPRHASTPIIFIAGADLPGDATGELCDAGVFDIVLGTLPPEALRAKARVHLALQERTQALHLMRIAAPRDEELFAMLGHELRNPLAAMICAIEVLKLRDPEPDCAVEILDRQARDLERVISEVVDGSRRPERTTFEARSSRRCDAARRRG